MSPRPRARPDDGTALPVRRRRRCAVGGPRRPPWEPRPDPPERDALNDLLVVAGRGDQRAYASLYDRTASVVFGLLRGVLRESSRAERAYPHLWRTAPQFDPTGRSAYSLLLYTARRELVGRVRGILGQSLAAHRPDGRPTVSRRDAG